MTRRGKPSATHCTHWVSPGVNDVRVGKIIDLDVEGTDRAAVQKQAEDMARDLLANLVIEDFTVEVLG
ncbi:phosphoribosyl formylglycinamidine synthase PurS [Acetobacter malorum]|uniref:Phosphoribosylformylglycinamidine synthase subunit PurS n=1 Tax=Acetobacter malorum TaxID=178901 RepID=A0A177G9B6_9PROT|nr:phosphoribosyl formylglycinamidine synthase PurS [Acetobacter malorum]